MWVVQASQMGIMWKVGNGKKIRYWEDQWFVNSNLGIQFWHLYVINEQHGNPIDEVWDGETFKLSFKRIVSDRLMNLWHELLEIVEDVSKSDKMTRLFGALALMVNTLCNLSVLLLTIEE
jgi:hypothetical protein